MRAVRASETLRFLQSTSRARCGLALSISSSHCWSIADASPRFPDFSHASWPSFVHVECLIEDATSLLKSLTSAEV